MVESLADVRRRERQPPEPLALDLIRQTAMGLAAIHATGTAPGYRFPPICSPPMAR